MIFSTAKPKFTCQISHSSMLWHYFSSNASRVCKELLSHEKTPRNKVLYKWESVITDPLIQQTCRTMMWNNTLCGSCLALPFTILKGMRTEWNASYQIQCLHHINFKAYLCIRHISDVYVCVWFKFHSKVVFPFNVLLFKYVFPNLVRHCAPLPTSVSSKHDLLINKIFQMYCLGICFKKPNRVYTWFLAIYEIIYFIFSCACDEITKIFTLWWFETFIIQVQLYLLKIMQGTTEMLPSEINHSTWHKPS